MIIEGFLSPLFALWAFLAPYSWILAIGSIFTSMGSQSMQSSSPASAYGLYVVTMAALGSVIYVNLGRIVISLITGDVNGVIIGLVFGGLFVYLMVREYQRRMPPPRMPRS